MIAEVANLVALGLRLFPVRSGRKDPVCPSKGIASNDATVVAKLLKRHHGCNIAVATGRPSGLFVLDVDVKGVDGGATLKGLEQQYGQLPHTWQARTPSGGFHLYFRQDPDREVQNRVKVLPGLDVRGDGGYVLAPPSKLPNGDYTWISSPEPATLATPPQWLLELIAVPSWTGGTTALPDAAQRPLKRIPRQFPARVLLAPPHVRARYFAKELAIELVEVASVLEGERNDRLFKAAARLGEFVAGGWLPEQLVVRGLMLAARRCGLTLDGEEAARKTIESGLRHGRSTMAEWPGGLGRPRCGDPAESARR